MEDVVYHSVDNFLRSCAGYVVTTHVMGIENVPQYNDANRWPPISHRFWAFLGNFKTKKIVGIKFKKASL